MPADILSHTPPWVWALLAALLALGYAQTRPRRSGPARIALLPLAMIAWSLQGVAGGGAAVLAAWLLGLGGTMALTQRLAPRGHYDASQRVFTLPGSGWPLVLMLLTFFAHYAAEVARALMPQAAASVGMQAGFAALYGALSGTFAGRALAMLRLMRPAHAAHA
jgi:hypothetical protein